MDTPLYSFEVSFWSFRNDFGSSHGLYREVTGRWGRGGRRRYPWRESRTFRIPSSGRWRGKSWYDKNQEIGFYVRGREEDRIRWRGRSKIHNEGVFLERTEGTYPSTQEIFRTILVTLFIEIIHTIISDHKSTLSVT